MRSDLQDPDRYTYEDWQYETQINDLCNKIGSELCRIGIDPESVEYMTLQTQYAKISRISNKLAFKRQNCGVSDPSDCTD